uniref:Uncharacterized protein n=1 Tax=Setaria italica TaxID=4555 RepID=K3XNP0_SETIT
MHSRGTYTYKPKKATQITDRQSHGKHRSIDHISSHATGRHRIDETNERASEWCRRVAAVDIDELMDQCSMCVSSGVSGSTSQVGMPSLGSLG